MFITSIVLALLAIVVTILSSKAIEISAEQDTVTSQVAEDWSTRPWTGIRVSPASQPCGLDVDGTEPVFYREWPGTKAGCKVPNKNGEWEILTLEEAARDNRPCTIIPASPPRN